MWWSRVSTCALSLTFVLGALGCGSSGFDGQNNDDALTMSFIAFSGEGIDQQDSIGSTSAEVDVCPTICDFGEGGIFGDETFEAFTQTSANALFVNNGFADILLDQYTVSIPGSGIPPRTVHTAALLIGGRCSNSPTQHCSLDNDCSIAGILGTCNQTQTAVEILLFDFTDKQLIASGPKGDRMCPGVDMQGNPTPGNIIPQTLQTNVTFSGSDESGKRFTVKTGLVAGFFDANNCGSTGQNP